MSDWEINDQHKTGIAAHRASIMEPNDRTKMLVCIEGNIGVGKSTLTRQLAEALNAHAMFEPVNDNPYLERFYSDPKRYALEMQFWLMSRRFEMHERAIRHIWQTGQTVVMDRSIYGDWVFAKKNWLDGNIDDIGYDAYLHHRQVMNRYLLVPHVVLSLEAEPKLCQGRIQERGRGCEKTIPIEYLRGLHELHRELALEMQSRGSRVVHVDWSNFGDVNDLVSKVRGWA